MKHKTTLYLTIALCMAAFLVACTQNEPMEFSDKGRVLFYEEGINNIGITMRVSEKNYSFTLVPFDQMEIETTLNVRLMGRVTNFDRIFRARVVANNTTAVEGTHFLLHDGVMKAGEYWSLLPITLYRTPDLQTQAVTITLELAVTDDLQGDVVAEGGNYGSFTLTVADYLLPPQNWPTSYFGAYSENKYRFVIATLGIADFPAESRYDSGGSSNGAKFTISEILTFQFRLIEAYAEYRKTNPPIYMDDDAVEKVEISFL